MNFTAAWPHGLCRQNFSPRGFGIKSTKLCAVILCSSGTTGLSKGTMLSSAQCFNMARNFPGVTNPAMLCFSSLYWLSGFTFLVYSLANICKRVITKRPFSPLLFVHLIERYKVNVVLTPPSQVALLVRSPVLKLADLSSIRVYLVGGGYLSPNLRKTVQEHLLYGTILVTYGMTELGGLVSVTLPFQPPSSSSGKVSPNTQVKASLG